MEVRPVLHVGTVVHLCRVFLNALTLWIDLVVLTPRFRVETLKDSWRIELHFMLKCSYKLYLAMLRYS